MWAEPDYAAKLLVVLPFKYKLGGQAISRSFIEPALLFTLLLPVSPPSWKVVYRVVCTPPSSGERRQRNTEQGWTF